MRTILFCLPAILAALPVASADTLIMPKELVAIAADKGCAPVEDFYDRAGPVDPPFVYGYLPGAKSDSAVFWCKNPDRDAKPYRLVIYARDPAHRNQCPDQVAWWNPPKGLSISRDISLKLQDFHYVDNPKQTGPAQGHTQGNVIVSSYDGVSEYFYCHNGKWLFLVRH